MQTANIMLALGGDAGNSVPKYGVTAAEIAVLRAIHGDDAVHDIEPTGEDAVVETDHGNPRKRTNREELSRLQREYASGRLFGTDIRAVGALFPGAAARVFEDIEELGLNENAFKPERRASATSKPRAATKKVDEPEEGLAGMTKAELVAHAEANGIEIDATAKKADIVSAIEAAKRKEPEEDGVGDMTDGKSAFE